MRIGVVIVAAGRGKRLGKVDKARLSLAGKPLFAYALDTFLKIREVEQIVLVLRRKDFSLGRQYTKDRRITLVEGGRKRCDSVYNGLSALDKGISDVLIHDGARPFVSQRVVKQLVRALKKYPAVVCGIRVRDTLKSTRKGVVRKTIKRENVFSIQTPQGFRKHLIVKAYKAKQRASVTDDAQLLERMGKKVRVIEGAITNFKITYPEDSVLARAVSAIQ